jgi:hypothetical protein
VPDDGLILHRAEAAGAVDEEAPRAEEPEAVAVNWWGVGWLVAFWVEINRPSTRQSMNSDPIALVQTNASRSMNIKYANPQTDAPDEPPLERLESGQLLPRQKAARAGLAVCVYVSVFVAVLSAFG